jgi:hypothetical protein
MTPKERAIELVNKYNNNDHLYYSITIEQAKICALIAVDEIIDIYWNLPGCGIGSKLEYWKEVKREIEKL